MTTNNNARSRMWVYDYVKFSIACEQEMYQRFANGWNTAMRQLPDGTNKPGGNKHSMVRGSHGGHHPLWVFEAYGNQSEDVFNMHFDTWAPYLTRVDVATYVDLTAKGLDLVYRQLMVNNRRNLNIAQHASRIRDKVNGRSAGGHGVAVGSHKSDMRMSLYTRGREGLGKLEFQQQGVRVTNRVAETLMHIQPMEQDWIENEAKWADLRSRLAVGGQTELQKASNLSTEEVLELGEAAYETCTSTELRADSMVQQLSLLTDGELSIATYKMMEILEARRKKGTAG